MKTLIQIFAFISLLAMASFGQTQYSILIDPGHGGTDPGTTGADGNKEKDITLKLGNDLRANLTSNNITPDLRTYMTRKTDVAVSLTDRANMAKGLVKDAYWVAFPRNGDNTKDGVDFFFSIHCNAPGATSKGTLGLIYDAVNEATPTNKSTNDYKFAKTVVKTYVDTTKSVYTDASIRTSQYSPDGVGGRDSLTILLKTAGSQKNGGFPRAVALLETEFVSNPITWTWLQNSTYQSKAVKGMAEGIKQAKSILTTVGVEDYIQFFPQGQTTYFTQNTSLTYSANFVDEYPYGDYIVGNFSWSLLIEHQEGDYVAATGTVHPIQSWQFTFGTLPYGYYWIRNISGNVKGRVKVTGTDNGGITHTAYYNIAIGGVPNNTTSGTLTHNETWGGENLITGSITVPSNITLKILPNANIKIPNNVSLIVYGTLNATNSTFTSLSGSVPGSWGSIILDGSGASGSILNYVNVQYGTEITVNSVPSFTINNSTIENMVNGVNAYSSNGWVMNSTISNSQVHGIISNSSTIACYHNTITQANYSGYGILNSAGGGDYIWDNDVSGFYVGIGASWGASANCGHPSNTGNNNSIINCLIGTEAYQSGFAMFGQIVDGEYDSYFTGNTISNNIDFDVSAYINSTVHAKGTSWNGSGPTSLVYNNSYFYHDFGGANSVLEKKPSENNKQDIIVEASSIENEQSTQSVISGGTKNVRDIFHYIKLMKTYNDTTADAILNTFLTLPKNAPKEAKLFLSNIYLKRGEIGNAKKTNADVSKANFNSAFGIRAKLNNFYITLYKEKDNNAARAMLDEISSNAKDIEPVELALAQHDLNTNKGLNQSLKNNSLSKQSEQITVALPQKFELLQNYPNPFNPTTIVSFSIPEAENVRLAIYDYLGREVAILLDGFTSAGKHEMQFDASKLASGVYFYKIISGKNIETMKMILLR